MRPRHEPEVIEARRKALIRALGFAIGRLIGVLA